MTTLRAATIAELLDAIEHVVDCDYCEARPIHRWTLESWAFVFRRCGAELSVLWKVEDLPRKAAVVQRMVEAIRHLVYKAERGVTAVTTQNAALRSELDQQAGGTMGRTREEVIRAAENTLALVSLPRVSGRTQYAATRLAEALRWMLEPPLEPTKTGFHPERPEGIA